MVSSHSFSNELKDVEEPCQKQLCPLVVRIGHQLLLVLRTPLRVPIFVLETLKFHAQSFKKCISYKRCNR